MHRFRLDALSPLRLERLLLAVVAAFGLSLAVAPAALAGPTGGAEAPGGREGAGEGRGGGAEMREAAKDDEERGDGRDNAGSVRVPAILERIAECESGGDPRAVSADGRHRGKYQFARETWRGLGGAGDPAAASEAMQDRLALALFRQRGIAPWPTCGRKATGQHDADDPS